MPAVLPPKFHGLITIDTTNDGFTITGDVTGIGRVIALTNTTYFIRGHTAAPADATQLVEHIQAQIRAAPGAEFDAFTCTVSDTGFVTMANPGGEAFTITAGDWFPASGGLARLLGFTGNLTPAATTFTGANQHRFGWYPDIAPMLMDGDPADIGPSESDAITSVSPDGHIETTSYNELVLRSLEFHRVTRQYIFPVADGTVVVNRDYESFWRDVLRVGRRFRYYRNRTVQTAPDGTAPWIYAADESVTQGGSRITAKTFPTWTQLYDLTLDLRQYVAPQ